MIFLTEDMLTLIGGMSYVTPMRSAVALTKSGSMLLR